MFELSFDDSGRMTKNTSEQHHCHLIQYVQAIGRPEMPYLRRSRKFVGIGGRKRGTTATNYWFIFY